MEGFVMALIVHPAQRHDPAPDALWSTPPSAEHSVMDRITIDLKHCYGIKALKHEFDFGGGGAYAIYAPNGSMKSSLAQTFKDAAANGQPRDRIFPARPTTCSILDETGMPISGARILVFGPYDEKFGLSDKTSTLLVKR
jgi:hypothetical protein